MLPTGSMYCPESMGYLFVHSFMEQILHNKTVYPEFNLIELYRSEIYSNNTLLDTPDPGQDQEAGVTQLLLAVRQKLRQ